MSKKTLRVGISALVVVGALSLLMYQTMAEDLAYYKHVDEVMVSPEQWYGKKMQIHGFVKEGSVQINRERLDWIFDVESNGQVVKAMYTGTVPDTFKDNAEVVLKGVLQADGFHVQPRDGVMAKCPSKYDPDSAGASR
ncbi:MAG: cytochrome c maturation protein CcmE [Vicinamibacterales bacterium]